MINCGTCQEKNELFENEQFIGHDDQENRKCTFMENVTLFVLKRSRKEVFIILLLCLSPE